MEISFKNKNVRIHLYYIYLITLITLIFIIIRFLFVFFEFPELLEHLRDGDYRLRVTEIKSGFLNFYNPEGKLHAPVYLIYWYFMFFPFSVLPFEVGATIFDILRLISSTYVAINIFKISEDNKNIITFFFFSSIGYFADSFLNNSNFVIQFLFLYSYIKFEENQKWLFGISIALSCFKITSLFYILELLLFSKIKAKDLIYILIPFLIFNLPFFLFPNLLFQFIENWIIIDENLTFRLSIFSVITIIHLLTWRIFQMAQLLYISMIIQILLENLNKWRKKIRFLLIVAFALYYSLAWMLFPN